MKQYVCGFMFCRPLQRVILIEKTHPEFQAGKWNGLGGKIEPDEDVYSCMRREFREEAGVNWNSWNRFAILHGVDLSDNPFEVHFFSAFVDDRTFLSYRQREEEVVSDWDIRRLPDSLANLNWLIPMAWCHDKESADEFHIMEIKN